MNMNMLGWSLKTQPQMDSQSNSSSTIGGDVTPLREDTREATPTENISAVASTQAKDSMPRGIINSTIYVHVHVPCIFEIHIVHVCVTGFNFDQKYHIRWQLSHSLTTQHLLTMVT